MATRTESGNDTEKSGLWFNFAGTGQPCES
jgi:hypothetical protein